MGKVSDVGRGFGGRLLGFVCGLISTGSKVSSRKSWVLPSHTRAIVPLYMRHTETVGQFNRLSRSSVGKALALSCGVARFWPM